MSNKNKLHRILFTLITCLIIFSLIGFSKIDIHSDQVEEIGAQSSNIIEGFDNIKATEIIRNVNLSSYGLVNIDDRITIKNRNFNPISSILIGIPVASAKDMIYIESKGERKKAFVTERNNYILNDYEMITVYFDAPLLPQESKLVQITTTFKDQLKYSLQNLEQNINYTGHLFPILPYKAEGTIRAALRFSSGANAISYDQPFGMGNPLTSVILYDLSQTVELNHLDPFLENMGDEKVVSITINDNSRTRLQLDQVNREILISPWGIIRNKEEHIIQNLGKVDILTVSFKIPKEAKNLVIFDDLGEITGTSIGDQVGNYQEVSINLLNNRAAINPNSKLRYIIQYNLPFENRYSLDWFVESINLDLMTTRYEFLNLNQIIRVVIEGCGNLEYISTPPDAIDQTSGSKVLIYQSEQIGPLETRESLFTFTINTFDLMFRPIIIILFITILLSLFVLLIKTSKKEDTLIALKKELIPLNEIREFCSLYEEKNALLLEIRTAGEEAKRKKMAKKSYKNIVAKNNSKIEQIKNEIQPFKKILISAGENFENIVKKLDVLDAERISVDDSITLLDNRYKRGKLPSRQAYQKLSNDFYKRRKKIDRTIDKYIQQLRSYLL